jgi:hypothetical protein
MLAALGDAIDNLDLGLDGDALAEAIALRSRLDAAIAAAVGEFDHTQAYLGEPAVTMTLWLRKRAGLTAGAAARLTHTGRRLHQLPALAEAWRSGALTQGQIDAILANVPDRVAERFAEHQHALIAALAPLTVTQTVTAMRHWRTYAEAELDHDPQAEPHRELYASRTLEGHRELRGHLDVEGGDLLATALDLADTDTDTDPADRRSAPTRRADALVEICRFFLTHRDHPPASRHRPHLNVILDTRSGHATTLDGVPVPGDVVDRLACDAHLRRVSTDGTVILDYGRSMRTAPAPLWNAIVLRDRHCRFPDCDAPPRHCQAHHIPDWDHHGTTSLHTMVLACTRHHKQAHQPGWHLTLLPDGELHITTPDGTTRTTRPPGPHTPNLWDQD